MILFAFFLTQSLVLVDLTLYQNIHHSVLEGATSRTSSHYLFLLKDLPPRRTKLPTHETLGPVMSKLWQLFIRIYSSSCFCSLEYRLGVEAGLCTNSVYRFLRSYLFTCSTGGFWFPQVLGSTYFLFFLKGKKSHYGQCKVVSCCDLIVFLNLSALQLKVKSTEFCSSL